MKNKNLITIFILIILTSGVLFGLISCGSGLKQLDNVTLYGKVNGLSGKQEAVIMVYNTKDKQENGKVFKGRVGKDSNWEYFINANYGTFYVCAIIDKNGDSYLTPGEKWGCNQDPVKFSESVTSVKRDITIK